LSTLSRPKEYREIQDSATGPVCRVKPLAAESAHRSSGEPLDNERERDHLVEAHLSITIYEDSNETAANGNNCARDVAHSPTDAPSSGTGNHTYDATAIDGCLEFGADRRPEGDSAIMGTWRTSKIAPRYHFPRC
jgi:hypothetical protein